MARTEHSREIDGKVIKFGIDLVTKEIDLPEAADANEIVSAIALEFSDVTGPDYPLAGCPNGEGGRDLCMAPGWTIRAAHKSRVNNPGRGSDFL